MKKAELRKVLKRTIVFINLGLPMFMLVVFHFISLFRAQDWFC